MTVSVRTIPPSRTHALRQRILRPHQSLAEMNYPGDQDAETIHLGAFDGEALIGVASLYHEPFPRDPGPDDWRLRGMAVAESHRGSGAGSELLRACGQHIRDRGGRRIWCNARTPAQGFYERFGFVTCGEMFDLVAIGPHVVMAADVGRLA